MIEFYNTAVYIAGNNRMIVDERSVILIVELEFMGRGIKNM
jgi:hypothetical protein